MTPQQVRLARAARPEHGDDLSCGLDVERGIVQRGSRRRTGRPGVLDGEHLRTTAASHEHPFDREHGLRPVTAMTTSAIAYAGAMFDLPEAREAEDRDGKGWSIRASDEDGGAELAEEIAKANPAPTARPRDTIGRSTHAGPRPADAPSSAAASRRGGVDRAERRCDDPHDERKRDDCLRDRARSAAEVGSRAEAWSKVTRKPRPSVTAETPSGSITAESSNRTGASFGDGDRGQPADTSAITVAEHGVHERVPDGFGRRDEQAARAVDRAGGRRAARVRHLPRTIARPALRVGFRRIPRARRG